MKNPARFSHAGFRRNEHGSGGIRSLRFQKSSQCGMPRSIQIRKTNGAVPIAATDTPVIARKRITIHWRRRDAVALVTRGCSNEAPDHQREIKASRHRRQHGSANRHHVAGIHFFILSIIMIRGISPVLCQPMSRLFRLVAEAR